MYAKYIKREIPDLNGTGRTQAYYQMELTPKSYEEFVSQWDPGLLPDGINAEELRGVCESMCS